jgi:hypothetical protein
MSKYLKALVLFGFLSLFVVAGFSQEATAVKGNIAGTVADTSGAVIPDAKVTITGPEGARTMTSDASGRFEARALTPGFYTVAVEKAGFRKYENKNIEVVTNRTSGVNVGLQPGQVSETVEVNAAAIAVDTTSTAVGTNLPDSFYQQIPVQRGVASLFYVAPGVTSGGGSGKSNPSISGGSGLENQYVADGVNITDEAFGGLGTFSRNFGSLGTGINLSFIKEVQVKTGGFEPQYGKSTGGIVQIVTKSGGDSFHGAISAYFAPRQMEATVMQSDPLRVNQQGERLGTSTWEGTAELGGYIPGFKEHLFFYASVDPTLTTNYDHFASKSPLSALGEIPMSATTYNYASKLTWKINQNHQVEGSLFGDPARTNFGPYRSLTANNGLTDSRLHYGSREVVARYNGTMSPSWLINSSWTYDRNYLSEGGFADVPEIVDLTQLATRGSFRAQGLGNFENSKSNNYGFNVDTSKLFKAFGQHTVTVGYRYERPNYLDFNDRSGPRFGIPAADMFGVPSTTFGVPAGDVGQLTDAVFNLIDAPASCTVCPTVMVPQANGSTVATPVVLQQIRGTFSSPNIPTHARYHVGYVNDVYSPNKYVNFDLGLRWEQYRMVGSGIGYTFVDNWSPRLGVSIDPIGDRKTKIFFNYGRYDYVLPLDAAIRSLSNELDTINEFFVPESVNGQATIGPNGTVVPITDAAHMVNCAPDPNNAGACIGGFPGVANNISDSSGALEAITHGTKQEYEDEYVLGFERQLPWSGLVLSARYTDRRLLRIIEDTGGISPEAALAGVVQTFAIANVNSGTDLFVNPNQISYSGAAPAGCAGAPFTATGITNSVGQIVPPGNVCITNANAGAFGADGVPDGFSNASRHYQSLELELNKSFSHNFTARINYRYAKLFGNYEGAYRNDNGQTDPGISSLFDFTPGTFGLLGDQFRPGYLNTDVRHTGNLYLAYSVPSTKFRGLTIGTGFRGQSGTPINKLAAHPVYQNSGEVPLGGRGSEGRMPVVTQWDMHTDFPFKTSESTRLRLAFDMFNILNHRTVTALDQNVDLSFGTSNIDFLTPHNYSGLYTDRGTAFQTPFNARASVRFEF